MGSQDEIRMHGHRHCPGGSDPIPAACLRTLLPSALCTGGAFEAVDGAYYGLAQTVGADPSAFGVADMIQIWNDVGDPSSPGSYFRAKEVDTGYVLQVFAGVGLDTGSEPLRLGYDGIVKFQGPIDVATITARLYLGVGVGGGGSMSHHVAFLEAVAGGQFTAYLHLSGEVTKEMEGFDPDTSGVPNTPDISPILLVEGANVDVTATWFELTILTPLTGEIIVP